ncbi:hypothetical protein PV325_006044 [Microctonus aethiopoides]|nr:hypothetical protein PV325_006044 [Microctonus aethiopoides]KAK0098617.1 hypothetical protein PV326_005950 [Microctonus aethiopoides]
MSKKPSEDYTDKLVFEAKWFDNVSGMEKIFYLYFFTLDNTIELFDIKSRKTFLRRIKCDGVKRENLYVGSMVTIFSRTMTITDIPDAATKNILCKTMQKTFAILKPNVVDKMGEIFKIITAHNLQIVNVRMGNFKEKDVERFYKNNDQFPSQMTSGPVVLLTLVGENAVTRWNELIGDNDNNKMNKNKFISLSARYGEDAIKNGFYGSPNVETAKSEIEEYFPNLKSKRTIDTSATFKNCTLCIILPHAVQTKLIGDIVNDIQKANYKISAIQSFNINPVDADEFLEVYKGIMSEYSAMVAELHSGPCIAMEITHENPSLAVTEEFRKFCGPKDPDIARKIRPNTLRAKYGISKVQNAIHCSDLPTDGLLEVEFFFKICDQNDAD